MKHLFAFLMMLGFALPVSAMSDQSTRESYEACMKFLKFSPEKQRKVAEGTQYTLKQVLWACNYQKKRGLRGMIEGEREYQRAIREGREANRGGGGVIAPRPKPEEPTCSSSNFCPGIRGQCINRHCRDFNPPFSQCDSFNSCPLGERCERGRCH